MKGLKIHLVCGSNLIVGGGEKQCLSLSKEIFKWPPRSITVTVDGDKPKTKFKTSRVTCVEYLYELPSCD